MIRLKREVSDLTDESRAVARRLEAAGEEQTATKTAAVQAVDEANQRATLAAGSQTREAVDAERKRWRTRLTEVEGELDEATANVSRVEIDATRNLEQVEARASRSRDEYESKLADAQRQIHQAELGARESASAEAAQVTCELRACSLLLAPCSLLLAPCSLLFFNSQLVSICLR